MAARVLLFLCELCDEFIRACVSLVSRRSAVHLHAVRPLLHRGAGYVWVGDEEIAQLAAARGITIKQFMKAFVRRVGNSYSLIEKPGGDCVFWDRQAGCTVYSARPVQCRTWPFWPENIESPEAWDEVTRICPGSGQGRVFSLEEIRESAAKVQS